MVLVEVEEIQNPLAHIHAQQWYHLLLLLLLLLGSPNSRHLYSAASSSSPSKFQPGQATKRLFDDDSHMARDPVMAATVEIPASLHYQNDNTEFGIHNSITNGSEVMADIPPVSDSAFLAYCAQRGISKLDINDTSALQAAADNDNVDSETSVASMWSRAHDEHSGMSDSLGGYVDRGNSLHRSLGAYSPSKESVIHDASFQSYNSLEESHIRSVADVAAVSMGAKSSISPGKAPMPPRPPSPERYEHEMHLDNAVTMRDGCIRVDDQPDLIKIAPLAATQMNSIDPADRADLDKLVMDLQYDYASNSEKVVRRLYDYPINAPKVEYQIDNEAGVLLILIFSILVFGAVC